MFIVNARLCVRTEVIVLSLHATRQLARVRLDGDEVSSGMCYCRPSCSGAAQPRAAPGRSLHCQLDRRDCFTLFPSSLLLPD